MTSGPQDRPQGEPGQQPRQGHEPAQSPPPYAQPPYAQPPYGQPYGQQPPYGQPYGQQYGQGGHDQLGHRAYPAAPGNPYGGPPAAPTQRPTTVTAGIGAFLLYAVLSLLSTVIGFANFDLLLDEAGLDAELREGALGDVGESLIVIGLVFSLAFTALGLLMVWFAWTGHNWARIVLWVLGGLGLLSVLGGFSSPLAVLTVLGVLSWLALVAGIVLLALRPSNAWYRAEGQRRRRF